MGQMKKIINVIELYENLPKKHKDSVSTEMEELKKIMNYKTKKELKDEGIQKPPPNCS